MRVVCVCVVITWAVWCPSAPPPTPSDVEHVEAEAGKTYL